MIKKDLDMARNWQSLLLKIKEQIGKRPSELNGVLFLIGVQELGNGAQHYSKEEKQDLIHLGVCKVLSLAGYYELIGQDESGWPLWELKKKLPHLDLTEQEKVLKMHVLEYFEQELNFI